MKGTKPVKRSEQLAPLSREHHHALLFIWKIRMGLKNHTHLSVIKEYIDWYWENDLKKHFEREEEILLPRLSQHDELGKQLEREHQTVRQFIASDLNKNSIPQLADTLEAHIRFEERELFPHIERNIPVEQLDEILKRLDQMPPCQTEWKNEFWKNK